MPRAGANTASGDENQATHASVVLKPVRQPILDGRTVRGSRNRSRQTACCCHRSAAQRRTESATLNSSATALSSRWIAADVALPNPPKDGTDWAPPRDFRSWRRSRSARSTWATDKSTTLPPLIKSRGAVTSRPSVFLLTSAQLHDQARSPTRVIHDTSAVSRHRNSRCHAPECIGSLKVTQGGRARAADYSTVGSVRQRLPDHANHSGAFSLVASHLGDGSGLKRRRQDFQTRRRYRGCPVSSVLTGHLSSSRSAGAGPKGPESAPDGDKLVPV